MKTQLRNLMACLLLVGGLSASCKCSNDKTTESLTTEASTATDTDSSSYYDDAADANATPNDGNSDGTSATAASGSSGKGMKAPAKAKKSGYSAANGTDAENHDGDPYTRNDTTPMPSGPPIK